MSSSRSTTLLAGRYALDTVVGRGGMGVVWRGEDQVLGRQVAVKRIGMVHGGADLRVARAEREARLAARLSHSHVVAVYDLVDEGDEQWLVMEYVDGCTLADLVRDRGVLDPDTIARILGQAADALAAAHAAGIVHRDVKPSNILIGPSGQVKLTYFGIARGTSDATLTETGLMSGSPAYLAPEVAIGQPAGPASDVWSLGATLHHALTGAAPYDAGNPVAALYRIVHEEPPRPADAGWLRPVLEATMTKDVGDRWTMAEVRDFLTSRALPHRPVDVRFPDPPGSALRHPARWLALAVASVAGVVLTATLLGGGPEEPRRPSAAREQATTASAPSPTATPTPTTPAQPRAAAMRGFAADYLSTATVDPARTWRRLSPRFQAASDGFASYKAFWSQIASARPTSISADPVEGTVTYEVVYTRVDGDTWDDRVTLRLTPAGHSYLVTDEE